MSVVPADPAPTRASPKRRPSQATLWIGLMLVGLVVGAALLSLVWTPQPSDAMEINNRLQPPGWGRLLGTDAYGRDVLSQVMAGARTALGVALAACALGLGIGAPLGLWAAARRGWVDEGVGRFADLVFAFPALLSAVLAAATLGPGAGCAVIAIGLYSIPVFTRAVRTGALRVWSLDYVMAARAAGKGAARISAEHVAPNLLPAVIVQLALQLSLAVVAEAGLAYVGLSAQPPSPSWGRMLADAQTLYADAPWLALAPGGAILVTVLGFNLLGEGLRVRSEP